MTQQAQVPLTAELPGQPGGVGRRILALIIDWVASLLIAVVLFPQFPYGSADSALATVLIFAAEVMVFTWLILGSFGQRIMGLMVVRMNGRRLPFWRVAVRTVLLCLVVPAVVFDQNGRGLHDRAADSMCIRARGRAASSA